MAEKLEYLNSREREELSRLDASLQEARARRRLLMKRAYARAARAAASIIIEACAKVAEEQAAQFLSPQYATGQPLSSFPERFACMTCANAIRALAPKPKGDE